MYAVYLIQVPQIAPHSSADFQGVTTVAPRNIDTGSGTVQVDLAGYDAYNGKTVTLKYTLTATDPRRKR